MRLMICVLFLTSNLKGGISLPTIETNLPSPTNTLATGYPGLVVTAQFEKDDFESYQWINTYADNINVPQFYVGAVGCVSRQSIDSTQSCVENNGVITSTLTYLQPLTTNLDLSVRSGSVAAGGDISTLPIVVQLPHITIQNCPQTLEDNVTVQFNSGGYNDVGTFTCFNNGQLFYSNGSQPTSDRTTCQYNAKWSGQDNLQCWEGGISLPTIETNLPSPTNTLATGYPGLVVTAQFEKDDFESYQWINTYADNINVPQFYVGAVGCVPRESINEIQSCVENNEVITSTLTYLQPLTTNLDLSVRSGSVAAGGDISTLPIVVQLPHITIQNCPQTLEDNVYVQFNSGGYNDVGTFTCSNNGQLFYSNGSQPTSDRTTCQYNAKWSGQDNLQCWEDHRQVNDGWIEVGNGLRYRMTPSKLNWNAARNWCLGAGGDLATSGMREDYWTRVAIANIMLLKDDLTWIGLNDLDNEGQWMWVDGEPATTSNAFWDQDEPSNSNGNEDCGQIDLSRDFQSNDKYCDNKFYGLCEAVIKH